MSRKIDFIEPTGFESKGGNKFIATTGVNIADTGMRSDSPNADIYLNAVNSRGEVSDTVRLVVHSEALGEVAAACLETWFKYSTAEARQELLGRLQAICDTGIDPAHQQVDPAPAPGRR